MSSGGERRPMDMSDLTQSPTTVTNIGVAMFTVSDQDAAIAFYTDKMGWELRGDTAFGPDGAYRWVEVAPRGSAARLALNAPMNSTPGGGGIGVETDDVRGEHARLKALGVDVDEPMEGQGAPLLFMMRDPDGNHIAVVEARQA